MNPINYLPILVASLASFAISSLWYSPILFGKEWVALSGTDMKTINPKTVWKSYIAQFFITLITFSVLAFLISMASVRSSTDGAFLGLLVWLGFVIPSLLSGLLWKRESFTLVLIDAINNLVVLTIGGAIIGAWR
ncbi:MAG: DUF1761 domain-containing protein [Candidatus Paceibacterota bacterium]